MFSNRFWVVVLAVAGLGVSVSGCKSLGVFQGGPAARPPVAGFDSVQIGAGVTADISVGGDFALAIDADRALARQVTARVEHQTLVVTRAGGDAGSAQPVHLRVVMPKLRRLEVSGSRVALAGAAGPKLDIVAREHGTVNATALDAGRLSLIAGDGSRMVLAGVAQTLDVALSGGSRGDARQLLVRNARVNLGEASRLDLRPERTVSGKATGGSRLAVWSKPRRLSVATRDTSDVAYIH